MTKRTAPTEKLSSSNPTELPPTADAPAAAPEQSGRVPFETLLTGLPAWKVAALKAFTRWPEGREVTQQEFDDALEGATGEVIS